MSLRSAHSEATEPATIAAEIASQVGAVDPSMIAFFCAHTLDGAEVSTALADRFPGAEVIGCTTAGEFTESHNGLGGTTALVFPRSVVPVVSSAVASFDGADVQSAVNGALARIEEHLETGLRALDPAHHVGVVLIDGLNGREEEVNRTLGMAAPFLSFVGGSAGDNLEFRSTRVFRNRGETCDDGAALAVLRVDAPFTVLKTCSFTGTGQRFTVTKAVAADRTVYEVDGRPVLEAYAAALDIEPSALDSSVFMKHPLGVMIDDQPWIRSPQKATPDGGLRFYCTIPEGMEVEVMTSTDLVGDTGRAIAAARDELGGHVSGALLFNCILRRLEMDEEGSHGEFLATFSDIPTAGFHTYGESWLGHINQTCTGILIG